MNYKNYFFAGLILAGMSLLNSCSPPASGEESSQKKDDSEFKGKIALIKMSGSFTTLLKTDLKHTTWLKKILKNYKS